MAQNGSRYEVLKKLIYPNKYFDGVTAGTTIKGWSPNNVRRIFIFDKSVFVQWYVKGLNSELSGINPLLNMKNTGAVNNIIIRGAEFKTANEAVRNDANYELPAMLDLLFKSGQKDGYKLANIEEVITVNLSDDLSLHDGRNYNTYKLQEYKRYIGVSELDVGSMEEFLKCLVKNSDKPVCFWGNAKLIVPNRGVDGKCLCENMDSYYSTFYTHAPGEAASNSVGVTYELDIQLRKKLDGIKQAYFEEKEGKKQEKEKETTDLMIFAKKLHNILNTDIIPETGTVLTVKKYMTKFVNKGIEKIDEVERGKLRYILDVVKKILIDIGLKEGKLTSFKLLAEGDENKVSISEDNYMKILNQALGVNGIYKSEYAIYEKIIELANKYRVHLDLKKYPDDILRFVLFLDLVLFISCIVVNNCKVQANDLAVLAINIFDKVYKTDYSSNVEKLGMNSNFLYRVNSGGNVILVFGLVNAQKSYRYTEFIEGFREKYKGKFDYDKIRDIVKERLGVTDIKELDTEQRDTFDGICIACAYYIMLVKYIKRDALKWVNIAMIKSQGVQLRHYLVISQVVSEYINDEDVSEVINAFSERINVEDDNKDKFSNKGEIHDMCVEIKKIGGILNGE